MQTLEIVQEPKAATTPPTEPRVRDVWRWKFHSIGELQKALEEYTAMIDLMLAPPLGKPLADDGGDVIPANMDTSYRIMAQNREIDRRMVRLGVQAPLYRRLLDLYYCRGLSCEAAGWQIAAKRCGLPSVVKMRRGRDVSRPQFEAILDMSLRALFYAR
jgi:hypothetical protein